MRKLLLVLCALSVGCIQFDDELSDCRARGGCGAQRDAGEEQDAGSDAGEDVDAGPAICPGTPGPLCFSNGFCQLSPAAPVNTFVDVFADERATWAVGQGGLIGCFNGDHWNYSQGVTARPVSAVMGAGSETVTVVAGDGTIRRWSYSLLQWLPTEELPAPYNQSPISDVWATPGYEIYAAGGVVCERRDGGYRCNVIPAANAASVAAASSELYCSTGNARVNVATPSGGPGYTVLGNGGTIAMKAICMWPDGGLVAGGSLSSPDGTIVVRRGGGQFAESIRSGGSITEVACASNGTFLLAEDGALFSCQSLNGCTKLQLADDNVAMFAVAERSGTLYAAGMAGMVQRGSATGPWSRLTPGPLPDYFAAAVAPDGGVYVAGADCTLLVGENDGGFASLPVANCGGVKFYGLHFQPDGTGWLVGSAGNIWKVAPGTHSASLALDPSPFVSQNFLGVAGHGNEVWAVGEGGLVARLVSDGGWEFPTSSQLDGGALLAIAARPDGGVTMATSDAVYDWSAGGLRRELPLTGKEVAALWVDDMGSTYAFGKGFTFRATDTATLFTQLANSPGGTFQAPAVNAVCGANSDVLIADRDGRILRAVLSSGTVAYVEVPSPTSVPLYGVACGATSATAVGAYGLITRGAR